MGPKFCEGVHISHDSDYKVPLLRSAAQPTMQTGWHSAPRRSRSARSHPSLCRERDIVHVLPNTVQDESVCSDLRKLHGHCMMYALNTPIAAFISTPCHMYVLRCTVNNLWLELQTEYSIAPAPSHGLSLKGAFHILQGICPGASRASLTEAFALHLTPSVRITTQGPSLLRVLPPQAMASPP